MYVLGGNLSEERFSPDPFPKTFCDVPVGTVTSAVKAQEFWKGGVGEKTGDTHLFFTPGQSVDASDDNHQTRLFAGACIRWFAIRTSSRR